MLRFIVRTFLGIAALLAAVLVVLFLWDRTLRVIEQRARERHGQDSRTHAAERIEQTGLLPADLRESSGVAVSRTHPGALWTHNDSGDGPVIYAIDLAGRLWGRFRIGGATAQDWEGIGLGPCPNDTGMSSDCLYVGDVGDNRRSRAVYSVFIIPEPTPTASASPSERTVGVVRRLDFTYVDGRHDCEAVAVSPEGDINFVTKGRNGRIQLYIIPRDDVNRALDTRQPTVARLVATLPIVPNSALGRMATGASISPSGSTMVVRTYTEVFLFAQDESGEWTATSPPCFLGDLEPGGEAVDFLDDTTLVLTSETARGRRGAIHKVKCRAVSGER